MGLDQGKPEIMYIVDQIDTKQEDLKGYLLSLGCYPGQTVKIISKMASNLVIYIQGARYSIDENLAGRIQVHGDEKEEVIVA